PMLDTGVDERVIESANFIVRNKATVRAAAEHAHVCKTTVHRDITLRLPQLDSGLYSQVREVLDINWDTKHIRGGIATRQKYHNS
ncbi:MAG TPA: sporulation transcriptional regulator SpoIIID, partial [Negativicutes bacterium]|nr:sporulation transcriptional regulator SpoIIID [Negativicutes bacterium]